MAHAISWVIENPTRAQSLGKNGRVWVERNLHPEVVAKKYADVIATITHGANRP
jgi:hypothetical protein